MRVSVVPCFIYIYMHWFGLIWFDLVWGERLIGGEEKEKEPVVPRCWKPRSSRTSGQTCASGTEA